MDTIKDCHVGDIHAASVNNNDCHIGSMRVALLKHNGIEEVVMVPAESRLHEMGLDVQFIKPAEESVLAPHVLLRLRLQNLLADIAMEFGIIMPRVYDRSANATAD